jgi:ubiquinol-cytochrome c reductase cytochrome b subunit
LELNFLGDVENFLPANSQVTPLHIKPEWYFLFAYSILRCIPDKTLGVLALLFSVLFFGVFVLRCSKLNVNSLLPFFVILRVLTITRAIPVEDPYTLVAQLSSLTYFLAFLG